MVRNVLRTQSLSSTRLGLLGDSFRSFKERSAAASHFLPAGTKRLCNLRLFRIEPGGRLLISTLVPRTFRMQKTGSVKSLWKAFNVRTQRWIWLLAKLCGEFFPVIFRSVSRSTRSLKGVHQTKLRLQGPQI